MEGDAGTRQLNPTDADETPDESLAVSAEDQIEEAGYTAAWFLCQLHFQQPASRSADL